MTATGTAALPCQWQLFLKMASHMPRLAPDQRDQLVLANMPRLTQRKDQLSSLDIKTPMLASQCLQLSMEVALLLQSPPSLFQLMVLLCCLAGFAVAQCINQHSSPSLSSPSPPFASGSPGGSGSTSHCDSGGSSSAPSATQSPAGIGHETWGDFGRPFGTLGPLVLTMTSDPQLLFMVSGSYCHSVVLFMVEQDGIIYQLH